MNAVSLPLIAEMGHFTSQVVWGILWGGLATITLSLLVLMQTRWGQARPVSKCVVLSIFAHLLLMTYAQVTQLFEPPVAHHTGPVNIRLSQIDFQPEASADRPQEMQPWDRLAMAPAPIDGQMTPLDRVDMPAPEMPLANLPAPPQPAVETRVWEMPELPEPADEQLAATPDEPPTGPVPPVETQPTPLAPQAMAPAPSTELAEARPGSAELPLPQLDRADRSMPSISPTPMATAAQEDPSRDLQMLADALTTDSAAALSGEVEQLEASTNQLEALARGPNPQNAPEWATAGGGPQVALDATLASLKGNEMQTLWARRMAARNLPLPRTGRTTMDQQPLPLIMQARVAENSKAWVEMMGGSPEIEPAVNAALAWLAANQESDGSWDVVRHGGGRETKVEGHDRQNAGKNSDMGITGLATLAFLAKGHTHLEGEYRENVQRALEYLVNHQQANGSLGGQAGTYAKMYCHAMALLAISEAYAMTRDERIRPFLDRALAFTVSAQHPTHGGWRYHPGDRGDMSQFGWQVLALHSAALSGIEIDQLTRRRMTQFLKDASAGSQKGLASYRPGERATATMTAEALTCRFFLGIENSPAQVEEATRFLLENDPASGETDLYYWYYGTLAMYQMQDDTWDAWAAKLQPRLLESQVQSGELAGSWHPSCRWGGYGGRVYSTAMAALSLEVYYRYLPIYRPASFESPREEVLEAVMPGVQMAEKPLRPVIIPR